MTVTRDELRKTYQAKEDEELLRLYQSGGLTDIAKEELFSELVSRNLHEAIDIKLPNLPPPAPSLKGTAKQIGVGVSGWIVGLFILAIVLVLANVALWGFGVVGAPLIWKDKIDQVCQKQGFWYGKVDIANNEYICNSWFVTPRRAHLPKTI